MKFKAVTSDQHEDDAATISQILIGNSLKPLAPVNLTGARNTNLDLVMGWTRRSRIAPGLRPFTDTPFAEESEVYEIEIYSGSTLKRTWRATPSRAQTPILWSQRDTSPDTALTESVNGGLLFNDFTGPSNGEAWAM